MYLYGSVPNDLFSNKVSLESVSEAFKGIDDMAKETIADRGKGKQRAVDEKKGQSDDDDDVIEIIERLDPKKAKQLLRKLIGKCLASPVILSKGPFRKCWLEMGIAEVVPLEVSP